VLEQNNFSNQKQIELLQIVNYALYKKQYPHDTCGIIERKIKLLEQTEQATAPPVSSNLHLTNKKGFKVNFIRVINCLFELSFFSDKQGGDITKKEVFKTLGTAINQDLSTFQNDLSSNKAAAKSDMKNTFAIFEQMLAKQHEINGK